jgi:acetylornithine/succinyldiaminopimelate/putrescine aminotransferase
MGRPEIWPPRLDLRRQPARLRVALRVLVEEGVIENAAVQRARFLDRLRSIRFNTIREVRGRGLMPAVERHPEDGDARRYCEALQGGGFLPRIPMNTRSASPRHL